jgi:hypothetical protein
MPIKPFFDRLVSREEIARGIAVLDVKYDWYAVC